MVNILWMILAIVLAVWLIGLLVGVAGNIIHVLLIVALAMATRGVMARRNCSTPTRSSPGTARKRQRPRCNAWAVVCAEEGGEAVVGPLPRRTSHVSETGRRCMRCTCHSSNFNAW